MRVKCYTLNSSVAQLALISLLRIMTWKNMYKKSTTGGREFEPKFGEFEPKVLLIKKMR